MEPIDRRLMLAGAGLAGAAAVGRLARAGPIDPPAGPVTPTGKTLDQVFDKLSVTSEKVARSPQGYAEARTPVESLPGSQTALHVITEPGCYYLTGNMTGQPGKCCIEVRADQVELECDGFTFLGVDGTLACIRAAGTLQSDGTVAHCRCIGVYDAGFKGWQGTCCDLEQCDDGNVEECIFDSCTASSGDPTVQGGACCVLGRGGVIYDCDSRRCQGCTMSVGLHGVVEECACTDGSGGSPCFTSPGDCTCEDNFAMNCDGPMFVGGARCTVLYNRCVSCVGGVDVGAASVVSENDLDMKVGSGAYGAVFRGPRCCCDENFVSGGGIAVTAAGSGTLIDGNHLVGSGGPPGTGGGAIIIEQGATNCCVVRNHTRATSVTQAFVIPPSNSFGPLANVSLGGDMSASPATTHPWANFVY